MRKENNSKIIMNLLEFATKGSYDVCNSIDRYTEYLIKHYITNTES